MNNTLQNQIEGLLFALGRPLSRTELLKITGVDAQTLETALGALRQATHGVALVDDGTMVELRTSPEAAALVEQVRRDEYAREIGKAGLETLTTVLYRGPLSRSDIDFIRGVNSSQTLRTLQMRGLVRRIPNPRDERSFLYEATTEVLAQLGLRDVRDLPDYDTVQDKLTTLETSYRNANA